MTCLITGCAFLPTQSAWVAGDLYEIGDTYVFVGNYDAQTLQPKINLGASFYTKTVTADSFLERRGVFVMEKKRATLSPEAVEYMKATS